MAFTTRRGRPPKAAAERVDLGTPELRFKHAHGLTTEPIDLCLEHQLITPAQHRSGLHLRWLYTIRYGAPTLTTHYEKQWDMAPRKPDDPGWRQLREAEYHAATTLLKSRLHYEPVMRLSVYNEMPLFMHPALRERAWADAGMAGRLAAAQQLLAEGLQQLANYWNYR